MPRCKEVERGEGNGPLAVNRKKRFLKGGWKVKYSRGGQWRCTSSGNDCFKVNAGAF